MTVKKLHILTGVLLALLVAVTWTAVCIIENDAGFILPGVMIAVIVFGFSCLFTRLSDRICLFTGRFSTFRRVMIYIGMIAAACIVSCVFTALAVWAARSLEAADQYADRGRSLYRALGALFISAVFCAGAMTPVLHSILFTAVRHICLMHTESRSGKD